MQCCQQTETQSVYQHGISVKEHTFALIQMLQSEETQHGWILPNWFIQYRQAILNKLLPLDIIEEYTTYHDCGKPYCLTYDELGKKHFPNHAEVSYCTWLAVGGNKSAAKLMQMDMLIHTIKAADLDEFIKHPETITLLISGLAEIHSNAKMFGGLDSTSFKIKWNQINKRGKAICQKLFGE
jgi:hypothetical protein